MAGVVAHGVEGRVREAEDDGEDGDRDVAEQGNSEDGDGPVFAGGYNRVEVAGELAAPGWRVTCLIGMRGEGVCLLGRMRGSRTSVGLCCLRRV